MALYPEILNEAEAFVFETFKRNLPEGLVYHTFSHSETVARTARQLAEAEQLSEEGIEIVMLAGWLHDLGYIELYQGHEEVSVRIGSDFLQSKNYPTDKIDLIVGCIRATKVPQQPKNILEEIVADADLASLGRKSFFKQAELLRIEWERALDKRYSEIEWVELNIDLLTRHQYFTRQAQDLFSEGQVRNLRKLYKHRQKKSALENSKLSLPSELQPIAGVTGSQSHDGFYILLHAMAQRQLMAQMLANQQLSMLMVVSAASILLCLRPAMRHLEDPASHIVPPVVIIVISILTLLLCRQGIVRRGRYFEDVTASGPFDEFEDRVRDIERNPDIINKTIITDCYEHKKVVEDKQRYLKQAVMIFLSGLLLAFVLKIIITIQ